MTQVLSRPAPVYDPAKGLLYNDHFQLAYVTNDLDRAVEVFRDRFGVHAFRANDYDLPGGAKVGIRTAWIGGMLYEICYGAGPGMELYTDWAPPGAEFVLKFHHFGYLIPDEEAWAALEKQIERQGWKVRLRNDVPGFTRAVYVEAPELGHFLEFVLPGPGLIERMKATPAS